MAADFGRLRTVDTELKQVLIDFFDDEDGYFWHHRILLVKGEPGVWIAATPTLGIQRLDLNEHRVLPLSRAAGFPAEVAGQLFNFDGMIPAATLTELKAKGQALASVLGFTRPVVDGSTAGQWVISDTGSDAFGEEVPVGALASPDVCVIRGTCGMVCIDQTWLPMEDIGTMDVDSWKRTKWSGGGKDPRIACHVTVGGRAFISERDAMQHWNPTPVKGNDNPMQGPLVAPEFFSQLRTSGMSLTQYDQNWKHRSGVSEFGAVARWHASIIDTLRFLVSVDQLDPTAVVAAEQLVRDLLRIETAVMRNSKQPDWEGLDIMTSSAVNPTGGVDVPVFTAWLSGTQRDAAKVLQQGRLLREERGHEDKRRNGNKGKGNKDKEKDKAGGEG